MVESERYGIVSVLNALVDCGVEEREGLKRWDFYHFLDHNKSLMVVLLQHSSSFLPLGLRVLLCDFEGGRWKFEHLTVAGFG